MTLTELIKQIKSLFTKDIKEEVTFSEEVEKEIKDNEAEVERNLNNPKYEAE